MSLPPKEKGCVMDKKEKLILEIMRQCAEDGEPVSREDAEEMAEMELKDKSHRRYELSQPRKQTTREKKIDMEKVEIIKKIYNFLLTNGAEDAIIINEQREIGFGDYSITLTKHRKKK